MNSVILQTSARPLLWTMVAVSIFVLLRGHNEPGGGFIGGLIGAAGLAVYAMAFGRAQALAWLRVPAPAVLGLGVLLALLSGLPGLLGWTYLTHLWLDWKPLGLGLGTALIFDVGVYLAVFGSISAILLEIVED